MHSPSGINVISVDVGTTSVRLAIIAFYGEELKQAKVLASHEKDIGHSQNGDTYEQSSEEIFSAICFCCKVSLKQADINPASIKSIGFSATCSLVVPNNDNEPNDVIMWMDHRAVEEARSITKSKSEVLRQFGGFCSPEFSLAKLVWLKNNASGRLDSCEGLFELPDWLVYRCIGGPPSLCPRSLCSLVCKWGYNAELDEHCDIIDSLFDNETKQKFSSCVQKPGTVSGYVSLEAAKKLGLVDPSLSLDDPCRTNIVVGTSLIDAHAGMLAMLSIPFDKYSMKLTTETTFCSLAGTSSCHMLLTRDYTFTQGIWGPYKNVVLDDFYLLEAGQTLTGKLIEICISETKEGAQLLNSGCTMKEIIHKLNKEIDETKAKSSLHVLPTRHGNRSPMANPRLRGGVYGLSKEMSLLDSYIAHVEAIAFETRMIVETLGIKLSCILVSGGLMKNNFYMKTLASVLNCQVIKISLQNVDVMVMGAALVARCAAINAAYNEKLSSPEEMSQQPLTEHGVQDMVYDMLDVDIHPPSKSENLEKKYSCYREFVDFSNRVDSILNEL